MTPTEAIDAMEGLGHDFFVFRDRNSNTIQVRSKAAGWLVRLLLTLKALRVL